MTDQPTLFSLDDYEQPKQEMHQPEALWYVFVYLDDGKEYIFWRAHDNGEDEFFVRDEFPDRYPHLYTTQAGALTKAKYLNRAYAPKNKNWMVKQWTA